MPAREMFFTFDKGVKINKTTVAQFVEDYRYEIEENFKDIKEVFEVDGINTDFLKKFIKTLKGFNGVSEDGDYESEANKIVTKFISDTLGQEVRKPGCILGIKYLYDEWEYEGTGYNDHYYYTYIDDDKMIKKTVKEAQKTVKKLQALGVDAELVIK